MDQNNLPGSKAQVSCSWPGVTRPCSHNHFETHLECLEPSSPAALSVDSRETPHHRQLWTGGYCSRIFLRCSNLDLIVFLFCKELYDFHQELRPVWWLDLFLLRNFFSCSKSSILFDPCLCFQAFLWLPSSSCRSLEEQWARSTPHHSLNNQAYPVLRQLSKLSPSAIHHRIRKDFRIPYLCTLPIENIHSPISQRCRLLVFTIVF